MSESELPKPSELRGVGKGMTDGRLAEDYLEDLRSGNLEEKIRDEVAELKEFIPDSTLAPFRPWQLWYIYQGLERLDLIPELKEGTSALAETIRSYGEREWDWA